LANEGHIAVIQIFAQAPPICELIPAERGEREVSVPFDLRPLIPPSAKAPTNPGPTNSRPSTCTQVLHEKHWTTTPADEKKGQENSPK